MLYLCIFYFVIKVSEIPYNLPFHDYFFPSYDIYKDLI